MGMITVEVVKPAAQGLATLDPDNDAADLVDVRDDAVRVDQNDAVLDALDDCFGFAFLINQAVHIELLELFKAFGHLVEFGGYRLEFGEGLRAQTQRGPAQTE